MTKEEKKELALSILSVVVAVGSLAAAIVAPGLLKAAPLFIDRKYVPRKKRDEAIQYALSKRWLVVKRAGEASQLVLTEKGRKKILRSEFGPNSITQPTKWDHKWRVVIFDIPDKRKIAREVFREMMRTMGFRKLQESVWVHPFPCKDIIDDLSTLYEVRPYVRVLLVQQFETEEEFVQKFNLIKWSIYCCSK